MVTYIHTVSCPIHNGAIYSWNLLTMYKCYILIKEKPQFRVIKFREKNKDIYFILDWRKVLLTVTFWICKYVFVPLNTRVVFSNRNVYFGIKCFFLNWKKSFLSIYKMNEYGVSRISKIKKMIDTSSNSSITIFV